MKTNRNIRLHINEKLSSGTVIKVMEKVSHYLCNVMRCQTGEVFKCFNAVDGEFFCRIAAIEKKSVSLEIMELNRRPQAESDVWLLFAPLKKDKTDFVIEKATELGVNKIIPVITRYTNADKIKTERFAAQAVEAAEQCGRLSVPEVAAPVSLEKLLSDWDEKRILFFMDERRQGNDAASVFKDFAGCPAAVLVGPEGGFSEGEAETLNTKAFVKNLNLGPRILRAETAAAAALAVWQACAGDWSRQEGQK